MTVARNTSSIKIGFRFETRKDMEAWMDEFREFEAERFLKMENGSMEMTELGAVLDALEKNMCHARIPAFLGMPAGEYETGLDNAEARVFVKNLVGRPLPKNAKVRNLANLVVTNNPEWGSFGVDKDETFFDNDLNLIVWFRCEADIVVVAAILALLFYPELVRYGH